MRRTAGISGTLYWRTTAGDAVAETDWSGNTTEEYVFFAGRRIAEINASGEVYYIYADQVGSTVSMTDASGNVCYAATYTPYGEEHPSAGNTCGTNYKFAGYERDAGAGEPQLDYALARYYSARIGRFMSADPLGGSIVNPQSLNRYAYVANNAVNLTDPTGKLCSVGASCWGDCWTGCGADDNSGGAGGGPDESGGPGNIDPGIFGGSYDPSAGCAEGCDPLEQLAVQTVFGSANGILLSGGPGEVEVFVWVSAFTSATDSLGNSTGKSTDQGFWEVTLEPGLDLLGGAPQGPVGQGSTGVQSPTTNPNQQPPLSRSLRSSVSRAAVEGGLIGGAAGCVVGALPGTVVGAFFGGGPPGAAAGGVAGCVTVGLNGLISGVALGIVEGALDYWLFH